MDTIIMWSPEVSSVAMILTLTFCCPVRLLPSLRVRVPLGGEVSSTMSSETTMMFPAPSLTIIRATRLPSSPSLRSQDRSQGEGVSSHVSVHASPKFPNLTWNGPSSVMA